MATIDTIESDVFTAMRSYLLTLAPTGAEVVRGQINQVAMPKGTFAVMTATQAVRLATNISTYQPSVGTGQKSVQTKFRFVIQVDLYGPNSQPWAAMAKGLFRDSYAVDLFPSNIVPLFADDLVQMPLVDGEEQWEERWKMAMAVEYQPIITLPQDFATSLSATIIEVDSAFAP